MECEPQGHGHLHAAAQGLSLCVLGGCFQPSDVEEVAF